ncbi:MAG: LysR family transcriptional regulator [Pseudomonadota bacterium]
MKLDPRHLEIIAAIVDEGGVTEAARAMNKSQPSLSRTLSQVESRLEAALFEPGRRPLQPTALGADLAEQGRRIRASVKAAEEVVRGYRDGSAGSVRIGGTPFFMDGVISALVADFQMKFPTVTIEQFNGYGSDLFDRVRSGRLDVAILPLRRDGVPEWATSQRLLPGRNVIACRTGHPLTRARYLTLDEITQYPWVAPPAESPLYRDLRAVLSQIGADNLKMSFSGGTLAGIVTILSESDALSVLPVSVVHQLQRRHGLAILPLRLDHPDRTLCIIRHAEITPSSAVLKFEDHIARSLVTLQEAFNRREREILWSS